MGFFSSSKKTIVSSVVYNLAGDWKDRANYLKTTVIGSITREGSSITDDIVNSYLGGPGIRTRAFGNWARTHGYSDFMEMQNTTTNLKQSIDSGVVISQIPSGSGETIILQSAEIGVTDYSYWSDQYVLANRPDLIQTEWETSINDLTDEITVVYEGGETHSFMPSDYVRHDRYLYAYYQKVEGIKYGPTIEGVPVYLGSDDFPDMSDWELISTTPTVKEVDLTTDTVTTVSYSDGRPNEVTNDSVITPTEYTESSLVYKQYVFTGTSPDGKSILAIDYFSNQEEKYVVGSTTTTSTSSEIIGGVTVTTTVVTTADVLVPDRSYRIDRRNVTVNSWEPLSVFIYRYGSGNPVLDALFVPTESEGTFLPFIPFRIMNDPVDETHFPDIYPWVKKAFKKNVKTTYDKILDSINDNDDIDDIDFAYGINAVALNAREKESKRYIYSFFQELMLGFGNTRSEYLNWKDQWALAEASWATFSEWFDAQSDESSPLYGQDEPTVIPFPKIPLSEIKSISNKSNAHFHWRIEWNGMHEEVFSGLGKPDAKLNELWFEKGDVERFYMWSYMTSGGDMDIGLGWMRNALPAHEVQQLRLYWQHESGAYRVLSVWGLEHKNEIYNSEGVHTKAFAALDDADESGFLIPIHEDVFRRLPLRVSTQVATSSYFLVFNCKETVRKKWYQTGLFQVVVVVVIIVVSVYFPPAGGAAGAGVLGTNAAVGAALGFTATAALVAGAIANSIAAMVIANVITSASQALLGDKIGMIVGTIASLATIQAGTAAQMGTSLTTQLTAMVSSPISLMKLSMSGLDMYTGYMSAEAAEMGEKIAGMIADYQTQSEAINDQYVDVLGIGRADVRTLIPPLESLDKFTNRTLLAGTDVSAITMEAISQFSSMTVNTNLP